MLATVLVSSIAEGALGYWWAKKERLSAGHATAMSLGALWGLGYGAGGNVLALGDNVGFRGITGTMLATSTAGVLAGHYYNEFRRPTEGDVTLASFTGGIGAFSVLSPLLVFEVEDERLVAGSLLAGARRREQLAACGLC